MTRTLFRCAGGEVVLPGASLLLAIRRDGGNLVVNPPRPVWERSELTAAELTLYPTPIDSGRTGPSCPECPDASQSA